MVTYDKKRDSISLVDYVLQARESGVSDRETIEALREKGHKNQEILEALKKADLKSASGVSPKISPAYKDEEEEDMEEPSMQKQEIDTEQVEALIEKIVEEKWSTVEKEISEIRKWKEDFSSAVDEIKKKIGDVNNSIELFKKSVIEKINSYSESIEDVGTSIQAMDMVFKKVLPELTSDVKELSSIVGKLKK